MFFWREAGGGGGEGWARGVKAFDWKQGTWEDGNTPQYNEQETGFPRKGIFSFFLSKYAPALNLILCVHNKKELSMQVENKPRVGIMRLFLVNWSTVHGSEQVAPIAPINFHILLYDIFCSNPKSKVVSPKNI